MRFTRAPSAVSHRRRRPILAPTHRIEERTRGRLGFSPHGTRPDWTLRTDVETDDAGIGATPHKWAKAASEWIRSGLSPAATRSIRRGPGNHLDRLYEKLLHPTGDSRRTHAPRRIQSADALPIPVRPREGFQHKVLRHGPATPKHLALCTTHAYSLR